MNRVQKWLHSPVVPILVLYTLVRLSLLLADVLSAHLSYNGSLSGPLVGWDGQHFIQIAQAGYPASCPSSHGYLQFCVSGFEPGFPLLIKLAALTGMSYVWAGLTISFIGGATAAALVWYLAAELRGDEVGRDSAVLFVVFPGLAVAWGLLYSESVGLALAAGCLLLMLRRRWFWAGLVGMVATATAPMALALAAAPLAAVAGDLWRHRFPRALATLVMTPLGYMGFALWEGSRYHDLLFWWHLQHEAWGSTVDFGVSLVRGLGHFWAADYEGRGWMEWTGILVLALAVWVMWKAKLPAVVNAYCVGVFALLYLTNNGFKPRLATWGFPVLVAVAAVATKRPGVVRNLTVVFTALLLVLFVTYTTLGNTIIEP
jgi:hypothetical protein